MIELSKVDNGFQAKVGEARYVFESFTGLVMWLTIHFGLGPTEGG